MQKTYTIIQPEYVSKFQCDGTICNAMCCQKWTILIDKHTFKKYKKIPDKNLRQKILSGINRNKNDDNYKIKLNQDSKCPHLCDDNLCFIQRTLGESYLSAICASYPRSRHKINGCITQSLALTCPLAAELALLNEMPMSFEQINLPRPPRTMVGEPIDTEQLAVEIPLMNYFSELQIFTISLLQNRDYHINERLIILGLFLDKANELYLKNESEQIPALIDLYENYITSHKCIEFINCIEQNLPEKIKLNLQLIDHLCETKLTRVIAPYVDMITQELNLSPENNVQILVDKYQEIDSLYYQPFLEKHSYILENLLVNDVFQTLFPFTLGKNKNLTQNYIVFISLFSIVNFFCLNLASRYKENLSPDHILKFIQAISRSKISLDYMINLGKELEDKNDDMLYFISACLK